MLILMIRYNILFVKRVQWAISSHIIQIKKRGGKLYCSDYSWSGPVRGFWRSEEPKDIEKAYNHVTLTGYSAEELLQIETAFEFCKFSRNKEEWMFNGLMNVVETLDKIHANSDMTIMEESKSRFLKPA